MDRADGPGVTVVGHARHFGELGLVQLGVRNDNAQRCVAGKQILGNGHILEHLHQGIGEPGPLRVPQAGDLNRTVIDVPQGVHRHQSPHLQMARLDGIGAKARFHGPLHPAVLPHRAARSSSHVSLCGRLAAGIFAGLIGHGRIRADIRPPNSKIKQAGLADQRDLGHTHVKADPPLLQIALDTAGGVQSEGAAAGEQHRVDGICLGHGRQELGLPGGGSSAPDIQPGGAHLIAQEHRAAGGGLPVLGMAHTKSPHFHNSDLSHLTSLLGVFYVLFSMTDLSCRNSHFDPAPHQSTEGAGNRSV